MIKKPGEPISAEEWNKLVEEVINLRKYVEQITRAITLTGLESPIGSPHNLSKHTPADFNYETEVLGLITKQYFLGTENVGEICMFGIHDFADVIYYWSSAAEGDKLALKTSLVYTDSSMYKTKDLFINDNKRLSPRSDNNPWFEVLASPNNRLIYRYGLLNPEPDKPIRYIIFEDINKECAPIIGNVLHYVTRAKPLHMV